MTVRIGPPGPTERVVHVEMALGIIEALVIVFLIAIIVAIGIALSIDPYLDDRKYDAARGKVQQLERRLRLMLLSGNAPEGELRKVVDDLTGVFSEESGTRTQEIDDLLEEARKIVGQD